MRLQNTLDMGRTASRLTISRKRTDSETLLTFDQPASYWLRTNSTTIQATNGTGIDVIFANINHRNIASLLYGMVLVLIVALGSLKLGLQRLVKNLAPAGLT